MKILTSKKLEILKNIIENEIAGAIYDTERVFKEKRERKMNDSQIRKFKVSLAKIRFNRIWNLLKTL